MELTKTHFIEGRMVTTGIDTRPVCDAIVAYIAKMERCPDFDLLAGLLQDLDGKRTAEFWAQRLVWEQEQARIIQGGEV